MLNKFNHLSFVIGFFFLLVALILLIGYATTPALAKPINLYTGLGMLVFALIMVNLKTEE